MMVWNSVILLIVKMSALLVMFVSAQTLAKTCPGDDMPDTVKVFFVKYKITDELWTRLYKEMGAPSNVRGGELEELILWKDYRWERRYGKFWTLNSKSVNKRLDKLMARLEDNIKRQEQGEEIDLEKEDRIFEKEMQKKPKYMVEEYDRISVNAPHYSLNYNRSNKTGNGVLGRYITKSDMDSMDGETRSQFDNWANSSFKDTDKILGLEKISTKKSKMLGYDVVCEITKTSFGDVLREYGQIEVCKATIAGIEVDLYEKMGKRGEHYIKQAVEINTAYPVKKERFCAPDYIKMRTH